MDERGQEFRSIAAEPQETLPGLTVQAEFHSGPLPHPELLRQYEAISPGISQDIVGMAKDALQANIDSDLIPIRAEAKALGVATFAVSFFPWVAIIAALIFLLAGYNSTGIVTGVLGFVSASPQIIQATRRATKSAPVPANPPPAKKSSRRSKNAKKKR